MENRIAPATATLLSGVLTIDYTSTGTTSETVTLTNDGANITLTGNISGATSNPVGSVTKIVAQDSGGSDKQSLKLAGASTYTLSEGLSCDGMETVTFSQAIAVTGSSQLAVTATKTIQVYGNLSTVSGNLTLKANQQAQPSSGDFYGIDVSGSTITSGSGNISLQGRGGDNTVGWQYGVFLRNNPQISTGSSGSISVVGTGGTSTGSKNHGVVAESITINSSSGSVSLFGQAGGQGNSANNCGIVISGQLKGSSPNTVTLQGTGGFGNGGSNYGLSVPAALTCTLPNNVTLQGTGGIGDGGNNHGVCVSAVISRGSKGTLTLHGSAGSGGGFTNHGVLITSGIYSTGASHSIIGESASGFAVSIEQQGYVTAAGGGNISVEGTGAIRQYSVGSQQYWMSAISGGDISVKASGPLYIQGGEILASGSGNGTIFLQGSSTSGPAVLMYGFDIQHPATISSSGGSISVIANGELDVYSNTKITSGGSGNITFVAETADFGNDSTIQAGSSGNAMFSINPAAGTKINLGSTTSLASTLCLSNSELSKISASTIQIGNSTTGPVTVSSSITRSNNTHVQINSASSINFDASLTTSGGNITLSTAGKITQSVGSVQTPGTLMLAATSQATFGGIGNKVGSLIIPVGVTCIVKGSFDSSGAVQVDGVLAGSGSIGTATVTGTGKVAPGSSPGKLTTGNIAFNSGSVFSVEMNGPSAGTDYDQLVVNGTINLGGATLSCLLGVTPTLGQVFRIIDNDGALDAVTGTFDGYPEGTNVIIGGQSFVISYKGGDGNDVTMTREAISPLSPYVSDVTFGDGSSQRSMVKQIVVTFSESVNFSSSVASAFALYRSGTGLPNSTVTLNANPPTGPANSVTITFSGSLTTNGSLNDGFYDFTIDASQVTGVGGKLDGGAGAGSNYSVVGNTANQFFRLFGDADGSGITDLGDFAAFRSVFNLGANPVFDYDNSGNVDLGDFAQFRARFNLTP